MQDAAPIPPGNKDPLAGDVDQYRNIIPLPLDGISTGRAGRPKKIDGGRDDPMVEDWEEGTGSEDGANKEEEEEEDIQEFPAGKAGQEKLGAGSGQLDQILESISAL